MDISESIAIAVGHHEAGRLADAESLYRQILTADPNNVAAWHLLGRLAHQAKHQDVALALIQRAIDLQPDYAEAYNDRGSILEELGRLEEAEAAYRRAFDVKPSLADAHYNLGHFLQSQRRLKEAVESYGAALELNPNFEKALLNLGNALEDLDETASAIECYRRALALNPQYAAVHSALGAALYCKGEFADAAKCYDRAIELDPELAQARVNRAHLWLLQGDYAHGWAEYEWRLKTGQVSECNLPQPYWNGEPLEGKAILLNAEQGIGDAFQFIRYAPLVKQRGASVVVVACQRLLKTVLAGCTGVDCLAAENDPLPPLDFQVQLLSLPRIFRMDADTIPSNVPYLRADARLVEAWKARLAQVGGFRIGINWSGRAGQGWFRRRDIPLEQFASLTEIPGVRLISLQKSKVDEAHSAIIEFHDLDRGHGAFMDTAAIMMNLDLVISSDTAIAHLAGALAVPVWLALPFVPDWRWLLDRTDSPWYPTMRLFRQKSPGDWAGVFDEINAALHGRLRG